MMEASLVAQARAQAEAQAQAQAQAQAPVVGVGGRREGSILLLAALPFAQACFARCCQSSPEGSFVSRDVFSAGDYYASGSLRTTKSSGSSRRHHRSHKHSQGSRRRSLDVWRRGSPHHTFSPSLDEVHIFEALASIEQASPWWPGFCHKKNRLW